MWHRSLSRQVLGALMLGSGRLPSLRRAGNALLPKFCLKVSYPKVPQLDAAGPSASPIAMGTSSGNKRLRRKAAGSGEAADHAAATTAASNSPMPPAATAANAAAAAPAPGSLPELGHIAEAFSLGSLPHTEVSNTCNMGSAAYGCAAVGQRLGIGCSSVADRRQHAGRHST